MTSPIQLTPSKPFSPKYAFRHSPIIHCDRFHVLATEKNMEGDYDITKTALCIVLSSKLDDASKVRAIFPSI